MEGGQFSFLLNFQIDGISLVLKMILDSGIYLLQVFKLLSQILNLQGIFIRNISILSLFLILIFLLFCDLLTSFVLLVIFIILCDLNAIFVVFPIIKFWFFTKKLSA